MGGFKDIISSELNLNIRSIGEDRLMEDMYDDFLSLGESGRSCLRMKLDFAKERGTFDAHTCKTFEDWFEQFSKAENEEEKGFEEAESLGHFKTLLTSSRDFMLLSFYLYDDCLFFSVFFRNFFKENLDDTISVKSSDQVILEMNKNAAITQSAVLRDLVGCIPTAGNDGNEIPLPQISSLVLPKTISFCKKKHKFGTLIESAVKQLKGAVTGTVEAYQAWVYRFVKTNKPLLSYLHQAADYLHIPTLLELTSIAITEMRENSVDEISEWYARLSLSRMLSPLTTEAYSIISHLDFFS